MRTLLFLIAMLLPSSAFAGTVTINPSGVGHTISTGPDVGTQSNLPQRTNLAFDSDYFVAEDSSTANATFLSLTTGTGRVTYSCPAGFTLVGDADTAIICLQTAEEGSAAWPAANDNCADTYNGRLPSNGELHAGFANYVFTDETDDWEWTNAACAAASANYFGRAMSGGLNAAGCIGESTVSTYRCAVEPTETVTTIVNVEQSSITVSCPSGFTEAVIGGRTLGCMETAEEGSNRWDTALQDCWNTYGGRLPTSNEWYVTMYGFSLTDETDDLEWFGDALGGDIHMRGGTPNLYTVGQDNLTNSNAYRCFIPNPELEATAILTADALVDTNNTFTGNNTHSGTETFSNTVNFSGTASTATFSGWVDIGLETITQNCGAGTGSCTATCSAGKKILGCSCLLQSSSLYKSCTTSGGNACLSDAAGESYTSASAHAICARVK